MVPETHFARVLHTNHVPSTQELNQIQHLVIGPQERIRNLNEEITRLQAERDELQRFVDDHLALAAPFRRFPADVWGEIFVHCLPAHSQSLAVCTVTQAPLLLTAVCRAWREIALNTPRLWSSVHFSVSDSPSVITTDPLYLEHHESTLQGMKLWLDRSGSRPLTLSIHMGDNMSPLSLSGEGNNSEFSICMKLMNLLVGYSRRWKSLSLGIGVMPSYQRALEHLVADDVLLLETVHTGDFNLFIDYHTLAHGTSSINGMLRPAPIANILCKLSSLRSLHLQHGSMASLRIPLDWARITGLDINLQPSGFDRVPYPIVILQRIAQTCRSLVILTFRSPLPPGRSLTGPLVWSTLQELRLTFDGHSGNYLAHPPSVLTGPTLSYVKDISSSIIAPQLIRLTLQFAGFEPGGPLVLADNVLPFHTLIEGTPHLTHLQIVGYHILGAEALSRCLQAAPSLITLKLEPEWPRAGWTTYTGSTVGLLRARPLDQPIAPPADWAPNLLSSLNELGSCPQLEVLDCGRCRAEDMPSILKFVQDESRLSRVKQLRADMGGLLPQQVPTMTSPSLSESLRSLRAMYDVSVDLKWEETVEPIPVPRWKMDPYSGWEARGTGKRRA
ncbi:hypothetical protein PQX77_019396 [Marasmius sp. AFHP31]|nr:hypothetical protein PQX77_019396 [Marasmius sp. AFHP31]